MQIESRWLLGLALMTVVFSSPALAADTDADGIDVGDNCPAVFNPLQADCNRDGVGDACNTTGAAGADADGDGVCDAVDNCSAVPNQDQGDCNGNGTGNMCEAANANRDDERDGICNGVDACPLEAGNCSMQAITVLFDPPAPLKPHPTYTGATHTLKGIARYGGNQFMWNFGDGTASTAWTAISNAYNLGVNHVYSGSVGQTFLATLSVRNSTDPAVVASATYRVQIQDSGPLPANLQMTPGRMDVRANMAIDQGLWYLHTTMTRSSYADGAPGFAQPYGSWSGVIEGTCHAVDAIMTRGHRLDGAYATDPYVETAQRSMNYLLAGNTTSIAVSNQINGRPDYNLNGIGLLIGPNNLNNNGPCAAALAHTGTPQRQSLVGANTNIRGRTYRELLQDVVELYAWGQADTGFHRGGWQYAMTSNSTTASTWEGGVVLALPALIASAGMGVTVPRFVRTEMPYFMNYARHASLDNRNGGWGYQDANDVYVNHRGVAAGMMFHTFQGDTVAHPNMKAALGFLYRYWSLSNYEGGGAWNVCLGNGIVMSQVAMALRTASPALTRIVEYNYNTALQTTNSFDWYYQPPGQTQESFATNLVRRQAANGMWSDTIGNDAQTGAYATALGIRILNIGATPAPPTATICDCSETYDINQSVTLEARCSAHPDSARSIVSYEWDFNYDGSTFTPANTGTTGTLAAGYSTYGAKPVALRVTDDTPASQGGARSSIATCSIGVVVGPYCPHARAGTAYTGFRSTPVQFDASASSDPDRNPLTFQWDFDNDGVFGAADTNVFGASSDGVGVSPQFSFATLGVFTVAVKVTDAPSFDPPCSRVSYATVNIVNRAPIANAGGPYRGSSAATFALNGAGSSDPDGDALISYAWDLDEDGQFTDSTSATPDFTIGQGTPLGTVVFVCLKVTDSRGAESTIACASLTVVAPNRPPACAQAVPTATAECSGTGVSVNLQGSGADPDGDALTYAWSTNCPGGSFSPAASGVTQLTLSSAGGACTLGCTATLTVRDGSLQVQCSAQVTINDALPPTFGTPPQNLTVECGAAQQAAITTWLAAPAATDVCTSVTVTHDYTALSGGCGAQTGSAQVQWTATDACTQTASRNATVQVVDTVGPTLSCPVSASIECAGASTPVLLMASAADVCSGALTPTRTGSGSYPLGVTMVEFRAADPCGNTGTCSTSITVVDSIAPAIVCPPNVTVECSAPARATGVASGTATASDACGAVTITDPAATEYPLGVSTVAHGAVDQAGLISMCAHLVTVVDTTRPVFDVASLSGRSVTGLCSGAAVAFALPVASDTCGSVTVACPQISGTQSGAQTIVCTATDEAGLITSANLVVTVSDSGCSQDAGSGVDGGVSNDAGVSNDGGVNVADAGSDGGGTTGPSCGCSSGVDGNFGLVLLALAGLATRRRRK